MKKVLFIILSILSLTSCKDYLNRPSLSQFDESNFWISEGNIRLFAQGTYTAYFAGYGTGYTWGNYFTGGAWADEYNATSLWPSTTATSGNGWSFTYVRRHNLMIARIATSTTISDEAKNHWTGIARFFRALEYSDLCATFGDMPFYDREIFPTELDEIYKDRQPIGEVVTKIIEDFDYAAANVRTNDGVGQVNKDVVLAYMVRRLLYFGTLLKYHDLDQTVATAALNKAKWAAEQLITGGKYSITDDYRGTFSTNYNLAANKEVIFYREYLEAKAAHCLVAYVFQEGQTGTTLRVLNSYLAADGLPIKQSPTYNYSANKLYSDAVQARDPRLLASFADSIRISGVTKNMGYSTTGIACVKFLPYAADPANLIYMGSTSVTACPLIRYGEILVSYAEIMAELGQFTQTVADATINKLRARSIKKNNVGNVLPKLPNMVVSGTNITANGVVINDPDRKDLTVSPILWEIRRERMVEMVFEGNRKSDLKRWKKYSYLKTVETAGPTDISIGATFDFFKWGTQADLLADPTPKTPKTLRAQNIVAIRNAYKTKGSLYVFTPGDSSRVATYNLFQSSSRRDWVEGDINYERAYFTSIPLDQMKLYKDMGYTLTQNPGWDNIP